MTGKKADWIIEDSEEEDQLCTSELDGHPSVSPVVPEDAISSIKPFTSVPAENTSHISSVGPDHFARTTISSFPPPLHVDLSSISEASSRKNTRPRPRPIFSRTGDDPAMDTSISDPVFPRTPSSDRRDQPMVVAHSDPTVAKGATYATGSDLIDFSPDIAERAKMRTRKSTKRSPQYTEDVIDITDDDLVTTPAPKSKAKPKPRLIRRTGKGPQLPSDPATVPILSSSPLLPPSDPFPASTVINSTPPRPYPLDITAAPNSPPQQSPTQRRKRKRTGHPHSPVDDLPDLNWPTTMQVSVVLPRSEHQPPLGGNFGATCAVECDQNLNTDKENNEHGYEVKRTPKKPKSSKETEKDDGSASAMPESKGPKKSRKKTVLEVVITSPRQQGRKKVKAKKDSRSLESNSSESRNDRPASSLIAAELALKNVEGEDGHVSPPQTSDGEDELILAPKRQSLSRGNPHKRTQKTREPHSVDNRAPPGIEPRDERVALREEEEESGKDEHDAEGASASCTFEARSRATGPERPAAPPQENPQPSVSVQEDDRPKPDPRRETPASGKLRYTLSRFDQKTPMRELIRRAASHPSAPFSASSSPIASPLVRTTKSALRRIAPLHATRRTPPPPPPRPPPPKKSKKMLELEEKWEMELEDEVEGWWALTDEERRDWRRAKRDKELGYDD